MPFHFETLVFPLAAIMFAAMVGYSKPKPVGSWSIGLVVLAAVFLGGNFFGLWLEKLAAQVTVVWIVITAALALIISLSPKVFAAASSVSVAGCLLIFSGLDLLQWLFFSCVFVAVLIASRCALKKGFLHPRMADEALLIVLVIIIATTAIPAIMSGWRSAEVLNRAALENSSAELNAKNLFLLLMFVAGVGAAYQWWRSRRLVDI